MNTQKNSEKMTAREFADKIGIPYSTLMNLCRRGQIDHLKIGARRYFFPRHLDQFKQERKSHVAAK